MLMQPDRRAGSTVLVVDDDAAIRSVIERLLRRQQIDVLAAGDVDEALAVLERRSDVQVLLVDLVLAGGESGEAIVRRARELYPAIQYAYISGHAGEAIAGVEDEDVDVRLLRKPFKGEELLRVIDLCLANAASS